MNRLILIGNGFDLAHGMKTKFGDFIDHYYCEAIRTFFNEGIYSDQLLHIQSNGGFSSRFIKENERDVTPQNHKSILSFIQKKLDVKLDPKSILLRNISDNYDKLKWVDIEVLYFKGLTTENEKLGRAPSVIEEKVKKYNSHFEYLKQKLIEYLAIQQDEYSRNAIVDHEVIKCFTEGINSNEVLHTTVSQHDPRNLYFLNFNYTNTLRKYVTKCNSIIPTDCNYIHGILGNKVAPPIFGFGDEFDKKYLEFEDEQNNELFKHIKSFEYVMNENYSNLLRFLEGNFYQVHIYGHSCGISDRTMLNTIFEHKNCKSIKVFYHQIDENTKDFSDKKYEIYRHFNKRKGMYREKLVSFTLSRKMPQPKIEKTV